MTVARRRGWTFMLSSKWNLLCVDSSEYPRSRARRCSGCGRPNETTLRSDDTGNSACAKALGAEDGGQAPQVRAGLQRLQHLTDRVHPLRWQREARALLEFLPERVRA